MSFPQFSSGLKMKYCGISSFPLELIEYSATLPKCKEWWQENHPEDVEDYLEARGFEDFDDLKAKGTCSFFISTIVRRTEWGK